MTVRIVQVGMGGWGLIWGEVVRRSQQAELVACCDPAPAALELARRRLGVAERRCFASLDQALAAVGADAVLVTANLAGHVPAALTALAHGKHVLVEKPFAPSLAEGQRVVDAAAERGCVLMVSQNYRFFPAVRAAAALLREGTLGPVGAVSIDFRRYVNAAPPDGNRHYTLRQPLLLDMAIHHFDLMRAVLGQEPRAVVCHAWNPSWSKFAEPAAADAIITFDAGAIVSYRGSWVSPAPQTAWAGLWRVECAGGEILWTSRNGRDVGGDRVTVRPLGKAARRLDLPAAGPADQAGSLAAFVQAIHSRQEPETCGRDNLRSLALAYAAIEAAASELPVPVPQL